MDARYAMMQEHAPRQEDIDAVRAGLSAFNRARAGDDSFTPITLLLRDTYGEVAGGLLGGTYWGWLVAGGWWFPAPGSWLLPPEKRK